MNELDVFRGHFPFPSTWKNLNHGSFGTHPTPINLLLQHYHLTSQLRPDPFLRYEFLPPLNASRAALSTLLNAPAEAIVLVPNATTGINTVLRAIRWEEGDTIVYFDSIYGACGKTVEYVCATTAAVSHVIRLEFQHRMRASEIVAAFREAVAAVAAQGGRVKLAVFDTVVSMPGLRMPFESLVTACREMGVLSCIDGAHGVGHVALDLSALDPDFLVSNCHKWLFTPRGCAVLYVPTRNQGLVESSLPTSHGYTPPGVAIKNPLPPGEEGKSAWVRMFEFVGTGEPAPMLCVAEALEWREKVCGGEKAIREYCENVVFRGARIMAAAFGTDVLELLDDEGMVMRCCMENVRLPMVMEVEGVEPGKGLVVVNPEDAAKVANWMQEKMVEEFDTFIPVFEYGGKWYVRVSGQVYLEESDFVFAGEVVGGLVERVGRGEYRA